MNTPVSMFPKRGEWDLEGLPITVRMFYRQKSLLKVVK